MRAEALKAAGIMLLVLSLAACKGADSQTLVSGTPESEPSVTVALKPTEKPKAPKIEEEAGNMSVQEHSEDFYYEELSSEVIDRIYGKSYKKDCTVPYKELRYVSVLYWGFDAKAHQGELIVNQYIAKDIVEIFQELYELKYPIERMVLVDEYDADDNASMAADNSSCFNYRNVDGSKQLSLHSYGLAIDINPRYNPYVRTIQNKTVVLPENGTRYADRSVDCVYYIDQKDACYKAFIRHGFTWGGSWKHSKDYQHFQKEPKDFKR